MNGKSIMGVLMLAAAQGQVLTVSAVGPGSEDCVRQIGELIANRFGEAQ
ncbi:MAG: HPr family phosphocarrier protein [Myxococcaceae bacterium]